MTTFLLIRHAAHSLLGHTIVGRMPGVHLSEEGQEQARRLAERLADVPIRAIYTSPLERARETTEPLARSLGQQPQICEQINEIDVGDWTGWTLERLRELPQWQLFNSFRSGTRAPHGETMLETQARMVAQMERLKERHANDYVALVSHGDVIKAAVLYYLGIPLDLFHRFEISPASVSIIALHDYGPQILCLNHTGQGFLL